MCATRLMSHKLFEAQVHSLWLQVSYSITFSQADDACRIFCEPVRLTELCRLQNLLGHAALLIKHLMLWLDISSWCKSFLMISLCS